MRFLTLDFVKKAWSICLHPEQTAWSRFWKEEWKDCGPIIAPDSGRRFPIGSWRCLLRVPESSVCSCICIKSVDFCTGALTFITASIRVKHINPYAVTDAGEAFPSGDAFLVYPGEGGVPEESIRLMLMQQVMQDVRAFELLESLVGREKVCEIIAEGTDEPITFKALSQRKRMAASLKRTGERGDRKSNCETIECTLCEHSIVMNKKRRARAGLLPCFLIFK